MSTGAKPRFPMKEFIDYTFKVARRDVVEAAATPERQYMFTSEEMGELAREMNRPERKDEGPIAECVDVILSAMGTLVALGGTEDDLTTIGYLKLGKWMVDIDRRRDLLIKGGVPTTS